MMRRGRFLEEDEIGHGERRLYRAVATTLPAARTRRRREQHGQHEHAGLQGRANGVRRISRTADTAGKALPGAGFRPRARDRRTRGDAGRQSVGWCRVGEWVEAWVGEEGVNTGRTRGEAD